MTEEQCRACAEQVKRECARADQLEAELKRQVKIWRVYEKAIKEIAGWPTDNSITMRYLARKAIADTTVEPTDCHWNVLNNPL